MLLSATLQVMAVVFAGFAVSLNLLCATFQMIAVIFASTAMLLCATFQVMAVIFAMIAMLLCAIFQVIAVIFAGIAMLLMLLSVAATTWLEANSVRQGLWEKCRYRHMDTDNVDCSINLPRGENTFRPLVHLF